MDELGILYEKSYANLETIMIPHVLAEDIFRIKAEDLKKKGISLLFLDLDNTLSPYSEDLPPEPVLAWMQELKAAGISPYIISNNTSEDRVRTYAAACAIPYVARAGKPSPKTMLKAMEKLGKTKEETALMGDQIFTDGLAARRAGLTAIVIRPLEMSFLFYLRYILEQPFRRLARERLK